MRLVDVDPVLWLRQALEGHEDLKSVEPVYGDQDGILLLSASGIAFEVHVVTGGAAVTVARERRRRFVATAAQAEAKRRKP